MLCYDESNHYREWLQAGKRPDGRPYTAEEYAAWIENLAAEDPMAFLELRGGNRPYVHHIAEIIEPEEYALRKTNPAAFDKVVQALLHTRAEIAFEREVQHKSSARMERFEETTRKFRKGS